MGGGDPFFEEAKVSGDTLDMIERVYNMFDAHPIYCCAALGTFFLTIMIYVFMQR